MSDLLFARLQMGLSLGFHIVFAAIGMGMPVLMAIAEWGWMRRSDPLSRELAKRWSKGVAVFFAVGAVSGTVLSFELGLLWPGFMKHAGAIIGAPFGLEGFAFFTEAIFLGLYIYGWDRMSRVAHWLCGVAVVVSGSLSAIFVLMVNGWMNSPTGFAIDPETGAFTDIDPVRAMFNDAWPMQTIHMLIAAYMATSFAVAGVHALRLLRRPGHALHRRALAVALAVAIPSAILQPVSGDLLAKSVARRQPIKLAAMEGQFFTEKGAPLRIGGLPDEASMTTPFALEIPGLLSFLAYADFGAEVQGLADFPRDEWPPVAITHVAFQAMVACGVVMLVGAFASLALRVWRRPAPKWLLRLLVACAPLGFIAIEAGWTVTEVGRQPWIIYGVMRTEDAVTPMPGILWPFVAFMGVYVALAVSVTAIMVHIVRSADKGASA